MKYFLFTLFTGFLLSLLQLNSIAQNSEIDSLIKIVNQADEDTVVINALLVLGERTINNPDKQLKYLEQALSLSFKNEFKSGQGRAMSGLGVYYTNLGDFDKAMLYLNEALLIFQEIEKKDMEVAVLGNQGNVYCYLGEYEKGLDCFLKALDVMYEIGNKSWIATAKNNIGSLYTLLEEDSIALIYYEDALNIYTEIGDQNGMSLATGNLANLYNQQGKHELAIENYLKAVSLDEKTGNIQQLAMNYTNLGKAYGDINDNENAEKYLEKAVDTFKKTGNKNGLSSVYFILSDFYKKNKEYKKSKKFLKQSFELSKEIGSRHTLMSIYKELAFHDSLNGDFFSAYENFKMYSITRDSIFNAEKSDQISELQIKFDTEKKEKDNEILREKNARIESENQRKNILIISGIGVLALMSILIIFVIRTNRIRKKINNQLQEKNFEINQQKEEISAQNDVLHQQNIKIEKDHKKITDSINYASRIQEAMLPAKTLIDGFLPENFIYFKARDIVSGDFYWIKEVKNHLVIAVADCTGHGVPGALVSMLGMSILNDIVFKEEKIVASEILENLRTGIKVALKQTGTIDEQKDGMDMGLCAINLETEIMQFSGANIPLFMFRNKILTVYKPVSNPIGISYKEIPFENYEIKLQDNDIFYLFSDGLVDQFHHQTQEKFKSAGLRDLFENIHLNPMHDQFEAIDNIYKELTGDTVNQTDDILVMGFKIT